MGEKSINKCVEDTWSNQGKGITLPSSFTVAWWWLNIQGELLYQPTSVHIFTASHLMATHLWTEHERRPFISRPSLPRKLRGGAHRVWWDCGDQGTDTLQRPKGAKGLEALDSRSKRDFTALPDGVFGLSFHHTEASPTVLSLWVSVWCRRVERSHPLGHSRLAEAMVDWSVAIANEKDVKLFLLSGWQGTARSFGDVLLEFQVFPGYSKAIGWGV